MSYCLARLDRDTALQLIDRAAVLSTHDLTAALPDTETVLTWPAVADPRIDVQALHSLRTGLLDLAAEHGHPGPGQRLPGFDSAAAVVLHDGLDISAHEAGHDDAWTWLTCCWLLDLAVWRFGPHADRRRFLGDVNRNTFRRLWWRREILGAGIDLSRFGEDELVSIMERPTLASDAVFARSIAGEFLEGTRRHPDTPRMQLMRETTKRLLRRTPFVDHAALEADELNRQVRDAVDMTAAALGNLPRPVPTETGPPGRFRPSPLVRQLTRIADDDWGRGTTEDRDADADPTGRPQPDRTTAAAPGSFSWSQAATVAVDLAARTGQVTNLSLRTLLGINAQQARQVLQGQVDAGNLARRGQKRGTHYTLAVATPHTEAGPAEDVSTAPRNSDTDLRQALDRAGDADTDHDVQLSTTRVRRDLPTVLDLVRSGLLPPGSALSADIRGTRWRVQVLPDGRVLPTNGGHPSSLASLTNLAFGQPRSAMVVWSVEREHGHRTLLAELRDELSAQAGWKSDPLG